MEILRIVGPVRLPLQDAGMASTIELVMAPRISILCLLFASSDNSLAPMPQPGRYMFVAAATTDRIYCVGGNDGSGNPNCKLHVYDVAANQWHEKALWPTPSVYPCGAAVGDKFYVVGGPIRDEVPTSVVQRYDPETNKWERLAD